MILLFLIVLLLTAFKNNLCNAASKLKDPLLFFCGSHDCYDILKVNSTATLPELKSAYRKMSVKMHPDKNRAENATQAFRLVSQAYKVLKGK